LEACTFPGEEWELKSSANANGNAALEELGVFGYCFGAYCILGFLSCDFFF